MTDEMDMKAAAVAATLGPRIAALGDAARDMAFFAYSAYGVLLVEELTARGLSKEAAEDAMHCALQRFIGAADAAVKADKAGRQTEDGA